MEKIHEGLEILGPVKCKSGSKSVKPTGLKGQKDEKK